MKKPHLQLSIIQRFVGALLLIGVLPLLTAGYVSYTTAMDALTGEVLTQQQQLLANYEKQLTLIQDQVESLVAGIAGVEAITTALRQPPSEITDYQQLSTQAKVGYILNGYLNVRGLISIHIFGEGGAFFQVGDTLTTREEPGVKEYIFRQLENNDAWIVWPGLTRNINSGSNEHFVLPAVKALYAFDRDKLERRRIGVVMVNFSVDFLVKQFADPLKGQARRIFLIDQHGRYIIHHEPQSIGEVATPSFQQTLQRDAGQLVSLNGDTYYLTNKPIKRLGWQFVSAISSDLVERKISLIGSAGILFFSLAAIVAMITALYFSRKVVSPITYVTHAFRRLKQGETQIQKLQVSGNDEISQLAQWFNLFLDEMAKRQASEEALRLSKERYELVARAADEGIWDLNHESGAIYFSERMREIIGDHSDLDRLSLLAFFKLTHPGDRKYLQREYRRFRQSEAHSISLEYRVVRPDGSVIFVRNNCQAIRDENGKLLRMVGSLQDISPQKQIEYRLRHDASHDPLTGLFNRAWMMKRIERDVSASLSGHGKTYAALFIDLDDFKTLNDTLGHSYGDLLLVETAHRIETCLRPQDALARLGGDEFIVFLTDIGTANAIQIVERLVLEIAVPYQLRGHEYQTRASIGVAFSKTGYLSAEEVLRDADTAMYRAKSKGKGQYVIFDNHMRDSLLKKATLEQELATAIDQRQLTMHYQPIVDLRSRTISGFEALLRWNHPSRQISPAEFIPVAEESALIEKLGNWVIENVIAQLAHWENQFVLPDEFRVAINISPNQFGDPRLIERIADHLAKEGIDPARLAIELTETAIFGDKHRVLDYLSQLKAMRISIYLDDFGTGYSSLSYLNSFPIDTIKIDSSFVMALSPGNREAKLVNTLILMARELGINVIAEGVEREELLEYLSERSCDYAQGFFIGRPMPIEQASRLLAEHYSQRLSLVHEA